MWWAFMVSMALHLGWKDIGETNEDYSLMGPWNAGVGSKYGQIAAWSSVVEHHWQRGRVQWISFLEYEN